MELVTWLQSQISNAAITSVLLLTAGFLLRTTISERIRRAVGHEYDTKLEELRTSNTKVLEELRSARAEREAFRAMTMSLMTSVRTSTLDRRVASIEVLWGSLQDLRASMPPVIAVLDFVGWDLSKLGAHGLEMLKEANYLEVIKGNVKSTTEVGKSRPFLGDQLYSLYNAALAIIARATTTSISSYQEGKFRYWFEERDTVELLEAVLNSEELRHFNGLKSRKLDWLIRSLESKIVLEIQKELSGEPAAEQALLQAARIMERAAVLDPGAKSQAYDA